MKLENLSDEQLAKKQKAALAAANRGAHVLGPNSLHCIAVEIARRRANGTWNPPPQDHQGRSQRLS